MPDVRLLLGPLLALTFSATAWAVTPDELASLARAGLGDEVLLALVESTGVEPSVDASRTLTLKEAGVSDRVIAAAVRASHRPAVEPPIEDQIPAAGCSDCQSNLAVIGGTAPVAVVEREVYYVPWILTAPGPIHHRRPPAPYFTGDRGFGRFINVGEPRPARR